METVHRRDAAGLVAGLGALFGCAAICVIAGRGKDPLAIRLGLPAVASSFDARAAVPAAVEKMPLVFVENRGQADAAVLWLGQAPGAALHFTREAAVLSIAGERESFALGMRFVDGDPAVRVEGRGERAARAHHYRGDDPAAWRTGLATYGEVVYLGLWPGIDLVYRGTAGRLKFDFIVAPGAAAGAIGIDIAGAESVALDGGGNLRIATPAGPMIHPRPVAYQEIAGRRIDVPARFVLSGSRLTYAVDGPVDPGAALVVDPGLFWSTYVGGGGREQACGVAVDGSGGVYVSGQTTSTDFPTTMGPAAQGDLDVFILKFDEDGELVYSTLIGGPSFDVGLYVAVDALGRAYVGGSTGSSTFPTTTGAFDRTFNGVEDGTLLRLEADGQLGYSTFIGGGDVEFIRNVATEDGKFYFEGGTLSAGPPSSDPDDAGGAFPTTESAFDRVHHGNFDAIAGCLDPTIPGAAALQYSTLFGGSAMDFGHGLDVRDGIMYIAGRVQSTNFPTTPGSAQPSFGGGAEDAFAAKFDPTKSGAASRIYITYLGGSAFDNGLEVRADAEGNAFVTGITQSVNFPTTPGAFQTAKGVGADHYVVKLSADGSTRLYSTFIGGNRLDQPLGMALDESGRVVISGMSASSNYPTTPGAFQEQNATPVPHLFDLASPAPVNALHFARVAGGFTLTAGAGTIDPDTGSALDFTGPPNLAFPVDDDTVEVPLGFSFPYDGGSYDSIWVNSDGNITLGAGDALSTRRDVNRLVTGAPRIAPLLVDLAPELGGSIRAKLHADRAVITWFEVPAHAQGLTSSKNTFQATLRLTGDIDIVYGAMPLGIGVAGIARGAGGQPLVEADLSAATGGGVTGHTIAEDFFVSKLDLCVTQLNAAGSALVYSTLLGGSDDELWGPCALDADGNAYVTACDGCFSRDFPVTPDAFDTSYNFGQDGTVTKLPLTPRGWIDTLLRDLKRLRKADTITHDQEQSLARKLKDARMALGSGDGDAAVDDLEAFIAEVQALESAGALPAADAASLTNGGASKVIRQIEHLEAIGEL